MLQQREWFLQQVRVRSFIALVVTPLSNSWCIHDAPDELEKCCKARSIESQSNIDSKSSSRANWAPQIFQHHWVRVVPQGSIA